MVTPPHRRADQSRAVPARHVVGRATVPTWQSRARLRDSPTHVKLALCRHVMSALNCPHDSPFTVPHLSNPSRLGSLIGWNSGSHPFDEGLVLIRSRDKIAKCGNATFENAMDDAMARRRVSLTKRSLPHKLVFRVT